MEQGGVHGVKLPRRVALPCRVQALGGGWLNVIIHTRNGGFAEETVFVVHQVLVDTGSRKTRVTDLYTSAIAKDGCQDISGPNTELRNTNIVFGLSFF